MSEPLEEKLVALTPNLDAAFESLSNSATAGDEVAREEMIATCRDYLLFIANQEVGAEIRPKMAPSDVVQNTMLQAVAKFDDFRGENQRSLLAWLKRILLNELHDARRQFIDAEKRDLRREKGIDSIGDSTGPAFELRGTERSPVSEVAAREEAARLRKALLRLSKDHQEVLRLRNWERLKFADIGEQMERSEAAVKKLWARAVEALKEAVEKNV